MRSLVFFLAAATPTGRMRGGQLMWFSTLTYERQSELIPICHAWVRPYGLEPVRHRLR